MKNKGNIKLIVLTITAVIAAGAFTVFFLQSKSSTPSGQSLEQTDQMITVGESNSTPTQSGGNENAAISNASGKYTDYSKEAFDSAVNQKRVYYFHAVWCPTCK